MVERNIDNIVDTLMPRIEKGIRAALRDEYFLLATADNEEPIFSFKVFSTDNSIKTELEMYRLTKKDIKNSIKVLEEKYIKKEE